MSTLPLPQERTPFDLLFRNLFKADGVYQPATFDNKQSHPLDIFYDEKGLHFEVACTGLTKSDIEIKIDVDLLTIIHNKTEDEDYFHSEYEGYIYKGLSHKSFRLEYKVAAKFELEKLEANMDNGLLRLFIPTSESKKPKTIKIK
jgi:HSP20 family molecular chaperone IbpA